MSEGVQLILWIAGVHLIGFLCVAVLLLPALREEPDSGEPFDDGDDGWGRPPRNPPTQPSPPRGGIPLPDAVPAAVRLREPEPRTGPQAGPCAPELSLPPRPPRGRSWLRR
jgi:hypothetical protein